MTATLTIRRPAVHEPLGALAGLDQEPVTDLRGGELVAQLGDPAAHQRRAAADLVERRLDRRRVGVLDVLRFGFSRNDSADHDN